MKNKKIQKYASDKREQWRWQKEETAKKMKQRIQCIVCEKDGGGGGFKWGNGLIIYGKL
jgi:hypothetical protein